MIKDKKVLAIIPARGGSKRLPQKNILPLVGKPLIQWTIDASKKSKYIDKIIVSSEDEVILNISKELNVDVIRRPIELATDYAKTIDVVKHVTENLDVEFDYIILLQPTSPLRNEKHIDEAVELLLNKKADAVISVCPVDHNPKWCNVLPPDLSLSNFLTHDVFEKGSQELSVYYKLNGAIYICKMKRLLEENTFFIRNNIFAYIMSREDSVDIDDRLDFKLAEVILQEKNALDL